MGRWVLLSVLMVAIAASAEITPPRQPTSGPGGSAYRHEKVVRREYGGLDDSAFWIFEPSAPRPARAPVVVFSHGWGAMDPKFFEAWIKHIVRRGNIVIYPRYQATLLTPLEEFMPNAVAGIHEALRELQRPGHVSPDLDRVAYAGHSMGGSMAANLAAIAAAEGLPPPQAVLAVEPASYPKEFDSLRMPLADFRQIPAAALMLVVVGDADERAGDTDARIIFEGTPQIPATNKNYIILQTDRHGAPPLVADHYAPLAGKPPPPLSQRVAELRPHPHENRQRGPWFARTDALDYYGLWKLFDALTDAAFYGQNRESALGNTPEQRFMGRWSDGTPVKELQVKDRP